MESVRPRNLTTDKPMFLSSVATVVSKLHVERNSCKVEKLGASATRGLLVIK